MLLYVLLAAAGYLAYDKLFHGPRRDDDPFVPIPADDEVVFTPTIEELDMLAEVAVSELKNQAGPCANTKGNVGWSLARLSAKDRVYVAGKMIELGADPTKVSTCFNEAGASVPVVLPDGTAVLPDGTVVMTDGTVIPALPDAVFNPGLEPTIAPENQGQYTPTTPTSSTFNANYWTPNACQHWIGQHALAKARLGAAIASQKHNRQWKLQAQEASKAMVYARARAYQVNAGACGMLLDSQQ